MKTSPVLLSVLIAACTCGIGCATGGARPPVNGAVNNFEMTAKFAAMDDRVQHSVTCPGVEEGRTDDGRLQIAANIRNRENRRIEVQIQCVFKDQSGFAVDNTPWQPLILPENGIQTVRFVAMNNRATDYTVRVREAR